jgi:AcrR family transcriptional regulator
MMPAVRRLRKRGLAGGHWWDEWDTVEVTIPQERTAARRGRPGYDRAQVLDIAVQLFNEQGYDATSVADLAKRLGLTKSALYHHFDSKDQLLSQALDVALSGLEEVLADAKRAEGSSSDQLRAVLRGAVEVLIERLAYVTLLLRVRGNSPVEVAALERRRIFDHRVAGLVEEAQREGLVRDDIDAAVATRLIFGMVNSVVEWYRPDGPIDRDELGSVVLAVVLEGVRAQPSTG